MNTIDDRTLEVLVDGELAEVDRANVLRQLDQSADGWRRLAFAFLADQTLKQTLVSTSTAARPAEPLTHVRSHSPLPLRRWGIGLVACAASALLAFALGAWSGRLTDPGERMSSTTTDSRSPSPVQHVKLPEPPRPEGVAHQAASFMPTLTPNTRKELERRGFVIQERPRVISVQREGRTIQVLVNEVELRYVGRQSIL